MNTENPPTISDQIQRKNSIINNTPAIFNIKDDLSAQSTIPVFELSSQSEVTKWCGLIHLVTSKYKVSLDLVKAIMFMETTHGWYDKVNPLRKTILPMNIHYQYWKDLGVTRDNLDCPYYNIEFGGLVARREATD